MPSNLTAADLDALQKGIQRLRTKWPVAHSVPSEHGSHLIVVPSVSLPRGYRENICTVLFVAPPGFPAAHPSDFFTDIDIRLENGSIPHHSHMAGPSSNAQSLLRPWPQWTNSKWWNWKLQMWDPNRSSLYTYMQVIRQRLEYVK